MALGDRRIESGAHIQQLFGVPNVTMEVIYEQDWKVEEGAADPVRTNAEILKLDRVVLSASGSIWAGVWLTQENGPKGWNNVSPDPKFPLVGSHPYCLIGRTNSKWFYVGDGKDYFHRQNPSNLDLMVNDDVHGNGSGAFTCNVQVWRRV